MIPQHPPASAAGVLSYRPDDQDQLIPQTVRFILAKLPQWRDDPNRDNGLNEKQLNSSLCDFLDVRSRVELPMIRFKHESPQGASHSADMGVHISEDRTMVAGIRGFSIYQPFLVIEAKRLPAPTSDREREYIVGTKKATGGIQRFKLGVHGPQVETAALIGYIEKESAIFWHKAINEWLSELSSQGMAGGCNWTHNESLSALISDTHHGTARSESEHERSARCCTDSIKLWHLWVVMSPSKPPEDDAASAT